MVESAVHTFYNFSMKTVLPYPRGRGHEGVNESDRASEYYPELLFYKVLWSS